MSVLQIFVTESELAQILLSFAEKHHLAICALTEQDVYRVIPPSSLSGEFIRDRNNRILFMFPENQMPATLEYKAIAPRYLGWIDIEPGRLIEHKGQRVLEMTTIQAEDKKELPFRAASWLRTLKKQLLGTMLKAPTLLVNFVYGGSRVFNDVGYSAEALKLFQEGVKWMQYSTDNQDWRPATPNGVIAASA